MVIDHVFNLDQRFNDLSDPLKSVAGKDLETMQLWVPSERIGLHLIDIPSAPERKWPELLPWMLEDRILQPVEEMHFVVVGRTDNQLQILAVSQYDMQEWIRIAENMGVSANAMAPDFMAISNEPGILSIGWREGVLLVRETENTGFSAHPDIGWPMVESILAKSSNKLRLSISLPDIDMVPPHLRIDADINSSSIDWQFAHFPAINLMTAGFKPKAKEKVWSYWWPVAASAIFMFTLMMGHFQLSIGNLEAQIEVKEKVYLTNFSQIFPGPKPSVNNLKSVVEDRIEYLFRQKQSLQAIPVSSIVELDPFMTACQCELKSLSVSEQGIDIKVSNGSKLTKKSLNIPGYQMSMKQVTDAEAGTFELSMTPVSRGRI